jgi:hypothetical protein
MEPEPDGGEVSQSEAHQVLLVRECSSDWLEVQVLQRLISGFQLADHTTNASPSRASNLPPSRQLSLILISFSFFSESFYMYLFRNPPTADDVVLRSQKLVLLRLR